MPLPGGGRDRLLPRAGRQRSNAVLLAVRLSARPRLGRHGDPDVELPKDVRSVVLHMIEETACHACHLDIARELLDGRNGLGLR